MNYAKRVDREKDVRSVMWLLYIRVSIRYCEAKAIYMDSCSGR